MKKRWTILDIKSRWLRAPAAVLLFSVFLAISIVFLPLMVVVHGCRGAWDGFRDGFSEWREIAEFRRTFGKVAKAFGAK